MQDIFDGYRALAAAVVIQAAREALAGDSLAVYWLKHDGPVWCDGLGLNIQPAQVDKFLLKGRRRLTLGRQHTRQQVRS